MSTKPMRIQSVIRLGALVVAAAATASCGDVVRFGQSPVMLHVNSLATSTGSVTSDVIRNVLSPAPCSAASPCPTTFNDMATASLTVVMKDVSVSPSTNNRVTVSRYRVEYRRADGRNTPGVDVPFPFDGAATSTIEAGGTSSVGFELVRHVAKEESPLVQLVNNPAVITTITTVTFFGTDQVGNDVSASGTIQIDFGNFGDTQ
jgi:hypothetical protein